MTTRRQFLNRSAWGFGSAFILPSLLASCTDHLIDPTNPTPPIKPPVLGEDAADYNEKTKKTVATILGLIPEGGEILSAMVEIFWPKSGNTWDEVKDQVEGLVKDEIDSDYYSTLTTTLKGLQSSTNTYSKELRTYFAKAKTDDPFVDSDEVRGQWESTEKVFAAAMPSFQKDTMPVQLLPLFAQAANMYLALYRDAAINADNWWRDPDDRATRKRELVNLISQYTTYVQTTYDTGLAYAKQIQPTNYVTNEPFKTTNTYIRQMTISVLEYTDAWPYFDYVKYPNGPRNDDGTLKNLYTREIYSDPFGNTYSVDTVEPIALPSQATQLPTGITVWGGHQIDAVQLTYPTGGGPNGATTTPRMGDQNGGTNQPPHGGWVPSPPDNPVTKASVTYDWEQITNAREQGIDTMYFVYHNGNPSSPFGQNRGQFDSGEIGYPGRVLSSIYIQGEVNSVRNTANCIIFGFMRWQSPAEQLDGLKSIYTTSPKVLTVADFAKVYPNLAIPANLITPDWVDDRNTYWDNLV